MTHWPSASDSLLPNFAALYALGFAPRMSSSAMSYCRDVVLQLRLVDRAVERDDLERRRRRARRARWSARRAPCPSTTRTSPDPPLCALQAGRSGCFFEGEDRDRRLLNRRDRLASARRRRESAKASAALGVARGRAGVGADGGAGALARTGVDAAAPERARRVRPFGRASTRAAPSEPRAQTARAQPGCSWGKGTPRRGPRVARRDAASGRGPSGRSARGARARPEALAPRSTQAPGEPPRSPRRMVTRTGLEPVFQP